MVRNEEGQAITEYILLLFAVISFYLIVANFITSFGLMQKLAAPITKDFAHAYQYGKSDVLGFGENGGPKDHPRAIGNGNNRLFINPVRQ